MAAGSCFPFQRAPFYLSGPARSSQAEGSLADRGGAADKLLVGPSGTLPQRLDSPAVLLLAAKRASAASRTGRPLPLYSRRIKLMIVWMPMEWLV